MFRQRMSAKIFSLVLLSSSATFAAQFEVPLQEAERIVVRGLSAQVQLVGQGGNTVRINGPEEGSQAGRYIVQKRDRVVEITMNEFGSKKEWRDALAKPGAYSRKIEINGASVPVEIHLRDGSVSLQKWTKEANINLVNGKVVSVNGSGTLQAHVQKGEITVSDHTGKVATDSYSAGVNLRNTNGDVEAQSFSGNLVLEKVKGFASVNAQQANVKVTQSSGTLQFENGKGPISIQTFQGRIEGQTGEGSVSLSFLPESELNLKAKSGRIQIQSPVNSGAAVNLTTVEGDISVPKELRVNRMGSEKNVRGRLRGDAQKGSIFVRSQEGSISLR